VQKIFCTTQWVDHNNFQSRANCGFGQFRCKIQGITFKKIVPDAWYSFILGTNYTIRLDFPLWVSRPRPLSNGGREDEFKFRYALSFQPAL